MNLRFHISTTIKAIPAPPSRPRMPSLIDVDVDYVDEPMPRGRSHETWARARGWASED